MHFQPVVEITRESNSRVQMLNKSLVVAGFFRVIYASRWAMVLI